MSAIRAASAFVELTLKGSSFHRGLKRAERNLANAALKMRNAGLVIFGIGATASAGLSKAVQFAVDLNEAVNKTGEVFGESARIVREFAKTSADSFGISKDAANSYTSELGLILSKTGSTQKEAANMSVELVKLAADMASFNNISLGEAFDKIKAGLVGSSEPLRSVGVLLSAAAVEAKAMELNLEKAGGKFTEGAKVAARYALILDQTRETQGDFQRTSSSLANVSRRIVATFRDMAANLGSALLPAYERFAQGLQVIVKWAGKFIENNQALVKVLGVVTIGVTGLGATLISLGIAISGVLVVMNTLAGVFAILTSPATLIAGAVGLLALELSALIAIPTIAFFKLWIEKSESARVFIAMLGKEVGKLLEIGRETFGGLAKALSNGEWTLAAKIAVAGVKAAFFTGIESIMNNWQSWLAVLASSFKETFGEVRRFADAVFKYVVEQLKASLGIASALARRDFAAAAAQAAVKISFSFIPSDGADPGGKLFGSIEEKAAAAREELKSLVDEAKELADKKTEIEVTQGSNQNPNQKDKQATESKTTSEGIRSLLTAVGKAGEFLKSTSPLNLLKSLQSGDSGIAKAGRSGSSLRTAIDDGQKKLSSIGTFSGAAAGRLSGSPINRLVDTQREQLAWFKGYEKRMIKRDKDRDGLISDAPVPQKKGQV